MACTTFVEYKIFKNIAIKPQALWQQKNNIIYIDNMSLKFQKKYAEGGLDPPDSPSIKNKVRKES